MCIRDRVSAVEQRMAAEQAEVNSLMDQNRKFAEWESARDQLADDLTTLGQAESSVRLTSAGLEMLHDSQAFQAMADTLSQLHVSLRRLASILGSTDAEDLARLNAEF